MPNHNVTSASSGLLFRCATNQQLTLGVEAVGKGREKISQRFFGAEISSN